MIERTRTITIASTLKEIHKVEAFIEEISDQYNINHTYFGHLLVSITEAVKNAIIHGNGSDVSKKVTISFEARESSLVFAVTDEGPGFDYESLVDPIESDEKDAGTGIFLISRLADDVKWVQPGNRIEFAFTIASINFIKSSERIRTLKDYYQGYGQKEKQGTKKGDMKN